MRDLQFPISYNRENLIEIRLSREITHMASIAQKKLFGWKEVENLGDLDRLRLVLENLPDEELMQAMEGVRGKGRDDYPVRSVWNSVIAGIVFGHDSIASLQRELLRNSQLRDLCGFDLFRGEDAVPRHYVYSRFLRSLIKHQNKVDAMFEKLVDSVREELPDFGTSLAMDSKAIQTHEKKKWKGTTKKKGDGRRDTDADTGVKSYKGEKDDGTLWKKVKRWFGYKLHLIVDSNYELPVAYNVTKASRNDIPIAQTMLEDLRRNRAHILRD